MQYEIVDLGSDSLLTTKVVAPRLTRDFTSPSHAPDDDISLRILRENIKIEKGVV